MADGAGLTMIEPGRSDIVVASAPFVTDVDAIQSMIGEGPCVSAVRERTTMRSGSWVAIRGGRGSVRGPAGWGVHSVVSLPPVTPDGILGAINVYAHAKYAFDDEATDLGELFAGSAAIAVQNAQLLAKAKRVAASLQSALSKRAVIDQAVGIVMSRAGCTADEAFDRLRQLSQTRNTKLWVLAQSLVDEAVRRARARHSGG